MEAMPLILIGTTAGIIYLITKAEEAKAKEIKTTRAEILPIPVAEPAIEVKTTLPAQEPKIEVKPIKIKKAREISKPEVKVLRPKKVKKISVPKERIKLPAIVPKHRIKTGGIVVSTKPLVLTEKIFVPAPIVSPPITFGGLVVIEQG